MTRIGMKGMGSLGDMLFLTPALKVIKDAVIEIHNDKQCLEVSSVFKNLAKVECVDNPNERPYIINKDNTHTAQRVLNYYGISNVSCIPKVILDDNEVDWAEGFLAKYKNPVVIVNDNAGSHDRSNFRAHYVRPPVELMQHFCNELIKDNLTVLQFGRQEDNMFTPLRGAEYIRGLNIRQILACFSVIGSGFFGDSGLYHAMLSVGGIANVFIPDESRFYGYGYRDLHYTPELWKGEPIRVKYFNFHKNQEQLYKPYDVKTV